VSTFAVVVIVVAVIGIVLAFTPAFSPSRVASRLGRRGQTWMDHEEDMPVDKRPTGDERDEPIPARPLRGRPRWSRSGPARGAR
jgi:hypothetical protein